MTKHKGKILVAGLAAALTLAVTSQSSAWMAGPMYGSQPAAMQQQQQTDGTYYQAAPGRGPMNSQRLTPSYGRTGRYVNNNYMTGNQGRPYMGCRW